MTNANLKKDNPSIRLVSVILPTFNNEKTLTQAILSVSKSNYPLLEIIVIDDGSTSKEAERIVKSLRKEINIPLIYKRKENGGPSSARNEGIFLAKGEWIAFLDSDDIMLASCIVSKFIHLDSCHKKNCIAGIYGSFIWSTTSKQQLFQRTCEPISRNDIGILGKAPGGAPSYIFKRDALLDINGFDEALYFNEDFDLLLRLIKSGYKLIGTSEPGFIRNINLDSLTRASSIKALKGGRLFLKKAFIEGLMSNNEIFKRLIINYLIFLKEVVPLIIKRGFK